MGGARHITVVVVTGLTMVLCAVAGSHVGVWMGAVDRDAMIMQAPGSTTIEAPAIGQPVLAIEDASVDGRHVAVDFYGNEVTDAVAHYTLDPTGTLYEEHSPETEVPRLGAPKS